MQKSPTTHTATSRQMISGLEMKLRFVSCCALRLRAGLSASGTNHGLRVSRLVAHTRDLSSVASDSAHTTKVPSNVNKTIKFTSESYNIRPLFAFMTLLISTDTLQ